jgi:L-cysteine:1D-myo-inositol 2-amino-2-deoxy-alpha-D-glucopyranoside ligase
MTSARWPVGAGPDPTPTLVLGGQPLPLVSRMRVYTCGITPYDVTHLGHAAVFVWTDLLRSVARLLAVQPVMARNVTDVDDVLSDAASRAGRHPDEYALIQEFNFDQDMASLGVATPDAGPRAHAHVAAVVQLAQGLLVRGRAYERGGHVFFGGADLPERLGLTREQALALSEEFGDQREIPAEREDALDVAVWRPSAEGQPAWPSPWGWGRPGWHAECAAMALTAHGASVDVLVGGADLAFPHHAHQAAMIEAVTGVSPFTRQHLHVGTVGLDGAKMAKSTGNLVLVRDLVERHSAGAVRLLLLNRPWATAWDYEETDLVAAEQLLGELYAAAGRTDSGDASDLVVAALLDDLDVPSAVGVALEHGGKAARLLVRVLGLGDSD